MSTSKPFTISRFTSVTRGGTVNPENPSVSHSTITPVASGGSPLKNLSTSSGMEVPAALHASYATAVFFHFSFGGLMASKRVFMLMRCSLVFHFRLFL